MITLEASGLYKYFHKKSLFSKTDVFYAIQDMSFTIPQGQTVGIIGTNGSGKTTLMRLLAGILSPSRGRLSVIGRIAPMISFNSCLLSFLTAEENISLMLSLFRLNYNERKKITPQILDFFEMSEFLDMPLKNFSSGMVSRLSFSIGVHLPSDILLLDEILAVGNEAFQKKCLDKISSIRKEGKTVLFSSHRMSQIQNVCDRVFWIHQGGLKLDGPPDRVVDSYLASQR